MKFKYYLRGAGVGIIVTAIIMSIAFANMTDGSSNSKDSEISLDTSSEEDHGETIKMANTESETATESDAKTDTETEIDTEIATEATTEATTEVTTETASEKESEAANENASETDTDVQADSDAEENEVKVTKSHTVSVIAGEVSQKVAERLEELGIVDDASAFNTYLEKNDYDNLIRPGTYDIEEGLDYSQVANILMKK